MSSMGFPALAIRPVESPVQEIGGVLALNNAVQQNEMGQVQLDQARQSQQEQQTIMQAFARNNGDWDQTLADIKGSVRPETWMPIQAQVVAQKIQLANLDDKTLDVRHKQIGMLADSLDALLAEPDVAKRQQMLPGLFAQAHANGIPIDKVAPTLAQLPDLSDASLKPLKMGMVGEDKFYQDEKAQREAQSMPSVSQAQAKTAAELSTAQTNALKAQREYDSMPSPLEASSIRAQEALQRQAQTAKDRAETANQLLDAKMKTTKLVYAVDANGQMNLLPVQAANAAGMRVYMEAPSDAYANEKKSAIELGSVQSGMSEYRAAANDTNLKPDTEQDKAMAGILSDNKVLGRLADQVPLGARLNDMVTAMQNSEHWNELDAEHQRLVASYLTAKIGAMNMQKLQGGSIGRNQEVIHAEFAAVPSPLQASSPSFNEQVDQFQKRLDVASQGAVRVPGVRSPQEIRADIESKSAQQAARDAAAQQRFQQNRTGQPSTQLFRPPISTGTSEQ